jgi:hypothetical protein
VKMNGWFSPETENGSVVETENGTFSF